VIAGQGSERPLLSELVRGYGLDLNIVHGQIDDVQGQPFGNLAVLARGAQEQLQAAVRHLRGAGVLVHEVCAGESGVAHA
jgi:D-methionine transport system ATP-binding protein